MKLGIIGFPQSGKSTLFNALTGARGEVIGKKTSRTDQRIGTVRFEDERVDFLTELYKPKKTTRAQVEYLLPSQVAATTSSKTEDNLWNQVRVCDALLHVLRNFESPGGIAPTPEMDFWRGEEDMIINDLVVAEKRIDRIAMDRKKGKKPDNEEFTLLGTCREILENNEPLRSKPELATAQTLRGFTFLSAKPQLAIINNGDEDESMPELKTKPVDLETLVLRGRLEMEIASMASEEAEEFLEEYHIEASALDLVIKRSYSLLNLISFFTVLNDEVRAWTIRRNSSALEAAGTVHTDMQKGFIRAEVVSFDHLKEYGTFQEAKKAGHVRLEGKEHKVQDGDIINFRFNI